MTRRTRFSLGSVALAAAAIVGWRVTAGDRPAPVEPTAKLIAALDGPASRPALYELERRALRGDAPSTEMAAMLRALWRPRVRARATVRVGDPWPVDWSFGRDGATRWQAVSPGTRFGYSTTQRAASPTTRPWGVEARLREVRVDDAPPIRPRYPFYGMTEPLPGSGYGGNGGGERFAVPATPGTKTARFLFEFRYARDADDDADAFDLRGDATRAVVAREAVRSPPFSIAWDETVEVPLTILPAGVEDDVERVVEPTLREAMARSIRAQAMGTFYVGEPREFMRARYEPGGRLGRFAFVRFDRPPIAIAADVWVRHPTTRAEFKFPQIAIAVPAGTELATDLIVPPDAAAALADARTIDLILRPSADAARRSVGITRMWDEPIVVEGLIVRPDEDDPNRPRAATRPADK